MNKKNISLILIGILLLVLQFYVRVGNATIDVFSDVIGFILIVIGILPLAPRNVLFKKARLAAILGTAAAVIGQALLFKDWGDSASQMRTNGCRSFYYFYNLLYLLFYGSHHIRSKISGKICRNTFFQNRMAVAGCIGIYSLYRIYVQYFPCLDSCRCRFRHLCHLLLFNHADCL